MKQSVAVSQRHHVSWPTLAWVYGKPHRTLAFGLGSGLIRPGSGTWGSVLALALWWPLAWAIPWEWLGLVLIAVSALGVWVCERTVQELGVHDHVGIVWDEIAAVWIVLWALPQVVWVLLLGFVMFRVFDIAKPWPIRSLDAQVQGGLGVMLDDWVAAIYAVALTWLVWWFVHQFVL